MGGVERESGCVGVDVQILFVFVVLIFRGEKG